MNEAELNKSSILSFLSQEEFDALIVHVLFSIQCILVLLFPLDVPLGIRMVILVLSYNILIPADAKYRGYSDWVDIWIFSFALSLFQLFPDWILSEQLDILIFPEDGFVRIGTVSIYMLGLWTIPVFIILFIGIKSKLRYSVRVVYFIVGTISFLIFTSSELFLYTSWHAQNVLMISNVAVYIIIPEILFGLTSFWMYLQIRDKDIVKKMFAAATLMIFYLGNAVLSYFIIEKIILPLM
ncbi:MAG: DUF6989 domain-containing protein [Candidatus Hodarchaeales archaeon]|jgi:hypothetical protein